MTSPITVRIPDRASGILIPPVTSQESLRERPEKGGRFLRHINKVQYIKNGGRVCEYAAEQRFPCNLI